MVSPDEPLEDAALGTGDELVIFVERWQMLAVLFQDVAFCSALVGEGDMEELATQCEGRPLEEVMDLTYGAETPELHGILQNNVFHCTREVDCCALFLRVARLNHCCRPNAFVDCARSSATVRCLTDIEEQQEILISYVPVSDPRPLRHEKLAGKGFVCDCLRCQELAHYARPPLVRAPTRTPR
ncbi:N-lysine methyltransferase SMYD2-B (Histone methyltransferase SMYD2-B) (SET and MYND domain-containing protein 2B) [Durusdinium trenchii]|uniref:N-lysine methyltransferase SMYD2-B (Histone methyltransferase SMYD2-B) (SET and MYND domain-containing protein 2B) n=1 Tax=Durusdinium trenchii TaxID=1381693 RepID=A0ABP0N0Q3_9DINO